MYDEAQPGDLLLVQAKGWYGFWIKFGMKLAGYPLRAARYTHVVCITGPDEGIEAEPRGARKTKLSKYPDAVVLRTPLDAQERDEAVLFWHLRIGIKYGMLDIVAQALACLGFNNRLVWKRLERPDRAICSQLGEEGLAAAGHEAFPRMLPDEVTPSDFACLAFGLPSPRGLEGKSAWRVADPEEAA